MARLGSPAALDVLLEREVRRVRDALVAANGPLTLRVISPLADGADRLFVHAAWRVEPAATLVVPLPFARRDYEASFLDRASVAEFRRLLAHPRCQEPEELPGGVPGQYMDLGRHVVDRADVMFFVYDGADHRLAPPDGGTASVLRYALSRGPGLARPCVLVNAPADRVTVWIPGRSEPVAPGEVDLACWILPGCE